MTAGPLPSHRALKCRPARTMPLSARGTSRRSAGYAPSVPARRAWILLRGMRRASACHHEAMKLLSLRMPKKFSGALRDEAGADAQVALFPAIEALLVPSAVLSRVRIPMRAPAVPDVQSARRPTLASLFLTGLPVLLCVHDSWCSPRRTCDRHKALTTAIDGSTGPPLGGSSCSGRRLQ